MLSHFLRARQTTTGPAPSGPLEYIGCTTAGITGNSQCILTVPSGALVGDLLVVTTVDPNLASQNGPSGWTERRDLNGRAVYSFVWDGGATSYTFTSGSTGTRYPGVMLAFRNAAFDVVSTISATADNPFAPAITISKNNSIQVVCAGVTDSSVTTYTQTSGFTEVADLNTLGQGALAVQIKTGVAKGSTGTVTYSSDGVTSNNRAWQFSISPSSPQLQLVSSTIATLNTASTLITATTPAGAVSGDLLVAVGVTDSGLTWTSPSGWTEVIDTASRFTSYRIHDGTSSSYIFQTSDTKNRTVVMLCFRNASWGAISAMGSAVTNPIAPTFTVPTANSLIIGIASLQASSQTYTTPSGWTLLQSTATNNSFYVFEKLGFQSSAPAQTFTSEGTGTTSRAWQLSISPTI